MLLVQNVYKQNGKTNQTNQAVQRQNEMSYMNSLFKWEIKTQMQDDRSIINLKLLFNDLLNLKYIHNFY